MESDSGWQWILLPDHQIHGEQGKVLDGNVGEPEGAASAPFKGVPYMVERKAAGPSAQWKFIGLLTVD